MKDIKDYLHLYLGCEAYWQIEGRESTYHRPIDYDMLKDSDWIKPILRPLSDMSEEEMDLMYNGMEGFVNIRKEFKQGRILQFDSTPEQVRYMLSRSFDLFDLIQSGLAIDKTTLK
jgi:hypothetical protein